MSRGFLRVDPLQGEADMHQHVVADLRIGRVGQIDGFLDGAEKHPAGPVPWIGQRYQR